MNLRVTLAFLLAAPLAVAQQPARAPTAPGPQATAPGPQAPGAQSGAAPAPNPQVPPVPDVPSAPALGANDDPPSERITFNAAVARALARNPSAEVADEEVHRVHALMEQVRSASLPTLNAFGTYTRIEGDRYSNGVLAVPVGVLNGNVTLTAPIIYPRGWVQWSHASDQIDVARANAADVRRTIAVETARAYLTIITEKSLVETARIARDNDRAHFDYTRARLVGGVGNRIDEVRAAQQLATDEATLQGRVTQLVQAREALGILLAADGPVDCADDLMPSTLPTMAEAMSASQNDRADVRARKVAATAQDHTVDDAYADYLPYLNLIAFPFLQDPGTSTVGTSGWEAQLILTIPLYDGGLRYGQEHERKSLAHEAHINVAATLRQARSDVRSAFEEMRRADEALVQSRQADTFAKQALDLANQAYHAGATTNLEVIDAERQARDADTQAAIAEDAARQGRLDFLSASGHFP